MTLVYSVSQNIQVTFCHECNGQYKYCKSKSTAGKLLRRKMIAFYWWRYLLSQNMFSWDVLPGIMVRSFWFTKVAHHLFDYYKKFYFHSFTLSLFTSVNEHPEWLFSQRRFSIYFWVIVFLLFFIKKPPKKTWKWFNMQRPSPQFGQLAHIGFSGSLCLWLIFMVFSTLFCSKLSIAGLQLANVFSTKHLKAVSDRKESLKQRKTTLCIQTVWNSITFQQ